MPSENFAKVHRVQCSFQSLSILKSWGMSLATIQLYTLSTFDYALSDIHIDLFFISVVACITQDAPCACVPM